MGIKSKGIKVNELTNVKTFTRLSALADIESTIIKNILGFWGFNFLPMKIREFSFKFYNNSLSLNHRIAHFVNGRGQECFFCSLSNINLAPRETFIHLFFYCDNSTRIRTIFETEYLGELGLLSEREKKMFWLFGVCPKSKENSNIFLLAVTQVFQYCIWHFKILKRPLVRHSFEMVFFENLSRIVEASSQVRDSLATNNSAICRNWDELRHRRG